MPKPLAHRESLLVLFGLLLLRRLLRVDLEVLLLGDLHSELGELLSYPKSAQERIRQLHAAVFVKPKIIDAHVDRFQRVGPNQSFEYAETVVDEVEGQELVAVELLDDVLLPNIVQSGCLALLSHS